MPQAVMLPSGTYLWQRCDRGFHLGDVNIIQVLVYVLYEPLIYTCLFQPSMGAAVQIPEKSQIPRIRRRAPVMFIGFAANPLTITLYLSKAIAVILHIETHPN